VQGIANVKVSSVEGLLQNSVERFLDVPQQAIAAIAKETLEANLRGVLATLTPEEVNEDRLKFAQTLIDEADDDIKTLGLELDVLKIQNVTDEVGYLSSVGRRQTAEVLKEARVAEASRKAEAEESEALSRQRAEIATAQADLMIVEQQNALRVRQAELEALAGAAEAEAKVAGVKARVVAEQALETERVKLETRRLEADVVAPAGPTSRPSSCPPVPTPRRSSRPGNAQTEVFRRLVEQYHAAGPDAQRVFVLRMLPELIDKIVSTVGRPSTSTRSRSSTAAARGAASPASWASCRRGHRPHRADRERHRRRPAQGAPARPRRRPRPLGRARRLQRRPPRPPSLGPQPLHLARPPRCEPSPDAAAGSSPRPPPELDGGRQVPVAGDDPDGDAVAARPVEREAALEGDVAVGGGGRSTPSRPPPAAPARLPGRPGPWRSWTSTSSGPSPPRETVARTTRSMPRSAASSSLSTPSTWTAFHPARTSAFHARQGGGTGGPSADSASGACGGGLVQVPDVVLHHAAGAHLGPSDARLCLTRCTHRRGTRPGPRS
jgi:hypothetical protein